MLLQVNLSKVLDKEFIKILLVNRNEKYDPNKGVD